MSDLMRKVILSKHPDYDFNRYRFKTGDIVETKDGAVIFVLESAINYVNAFVLRPSLKFRIKQEQLVYYKDLPYIARGCFTNTPWRVSRKLKWSVGDIVIDPNTKAKLLLLDECNLGFYAFVIESSLTYYVHTRIYTVNPYIDYLEGE